MDAATVCLWPTPETLSLYGRSTTIRAKQPVIPRQGLLGISAMKPKRILLSCLSMLSLSACGSNIITADTTTWDLYVSDVAGFQIRYELPKNARQTVGPFSEVVLSGLPAFGTVFEFGYDHDPNSWQLPRFHVSMQVKGFAEKSTVDNMESFIAALVRHYNVVTEGTISPSDLSASDMEVVSLGSYVYALIRGEDFSTYLIYLDTGYFLQISGSFGRYSNQSEEWRSNRRALFDQIVSKIEISSTSSFE